MRLFGAMFLGFVLMAGLPTMAAESDGELEVFLKTGQSSGPLEQLRGNTKVKKSGTYDIMYSMNLLQKGFTKTRVRIGFCREKNYEGCKYYSLSPMAYDIIHPNKNKTAVFLSGQCRINLSAGETISVGLIKDPISPARPETINQKTDLILKAVPVADLP